MAEPETPDFDFDAHIAKLIAARFVALDKIIKNCISNCNQK